MTLQLYSFARNSLKYTTRCCFLFVSIKFPFILLISQKDAVTSQPAVLFFFFLWHNNPTRAWAGSLLMSLDHTQLKTRTHTYTHTHTHRKTPVNERSTGRRRPLQTLHITNKRQTFHVLNMIRSHDPSNQAVTELRL
jgi:hypothetical protein